MRRARFGLDAFAAGGGTGLVADLDDEGLIDLPGVLTRSLGLFMGLELLLFAAGEIISLFRAVQGEPGHDAQGRQTGIFLDIMGVLDGCVEKFEDEGQPDPAEEAEDEGQGQVHLLVGLGRPDRHAGPCRPRGYWTF